MFFSSARHLFRHCFPVFFKKRLIDMEGERGMRGSLVDAQGPSGWRKKEWILLITYFF